MNRTHELKKRSQIAESYIGKSDILDPKSKRCWDLYTDERCYTFEEIAQMVGDKDRRFSGLRISRAMKKMDRVL
jgi:hypothetical protein